MAYSFLAINCMDKQSSALVSQRIKKVQDHLFEITNFHDGKDEPSTATWISDRQTYPSVFDSAKSAVQRRYRYTPENQAEEREISVNSVIEEIKREVLMEFYCMLRKRRQREYRELSKIKQLQSSKQTRNGSVKKLKRRMFWNRKESSFTVV
ncbi:hypothetical protein CPLU01_10785 [Colletotrichum plurivorum]|uniref:Uncharacterized protein n=1 Tax=Colletotrichum plurivorum TaxID=2175906 RepID=A0A8H6K4G0_9PEZI|nr:hypothetical protein CPLU01_10785 [Colletotrichum plurivorum]